VRLGGNEDLLIGQAPSYENETPKPRDDDCPDVRRRWRAAQGCGPKVASLLRNANANRLCRVASVRSVSPD